MELLKAGEDHLNRVEGLGKEAEGVGLYWARLDAHGFLWSYPPFGGMGWHDEEREEMNWRSFFDNPEEFFIGACLQFPLIFLAGWWVLPIMGLCAVLWRLGGAEGGSKLFRRLGVPFVVCGSAMLFGAGWTIILAVPFMVWLAPSYGVDSWLFKLVKNDFLARLICFGWYWTAFAIAYALSILK